MKKAIEKIPPVIKKPLSFIVNHNQVAPVKGEVTLKTSGNPTLKGGEEVRSVAHGTYLITSRGLKYRVTALS